MLIKEALSILLATNSRIQDLGVELLSLNDSPIQPAKQDQLNDIVMRYTMLLQHIILNNDGDDILGTIGENDADLNAILVDLQTLAQTNNIPGLPIPRIIYISEAAGAGLPSGSLGDLLYNNGTGWVPFSKGATGEVLVSTLTTIQWQSVVGNGIPSGGSTGQFLKKNSNTSYDAVWAGIAPSDITGLTASAAELNILTGATFSTAEANLLTGLTGGSLQSQLAAKLGTGLANGSFYVGNGSGVATAVAPTGDVTFSNAGVFAIGAGVIVNADINATAGITRTKLASGNNYRLVINGAAGAMDEAGAITASRVLVSDANGIPTHSTISETTLGFLDATSSIQTQIDSKLTVSLTAPAQGDMLRFNGTNWVNFTVGTNGQLLSSNGTDPVWVTDPPTGLPSGGTTAQYLRKIDATDYNAEWGTLVMANVTDVSATAAEVNILSGVTVTAAKINYLTDVTSNIQAQVDQKLSKGLTENYLFIGNVSNVAVGFATGTNGYVLTSVGGVPTWSAPGSGGTVTSVQVAGGTTGLTFSGGPINTNGTITMAGTLAGANGGTGFSTYVIGDLLTANSTNTLAKIAAGTATYVLTSNGPGTQPTWQAGGGGGDMLLASVQTVTGLKTFDKDKIATKGTSTGVTTISTANVGAIDYIATLQAATGTIAYISDITGNNSGTNTGDNAVNSLYSGLVSNATHTGDVTGATVLTIANDVVTYAKMQNVAANTFLANATGSAADVQEIATTRIPLFSSAITGTPSGTTFLRGDGTWSVPAGLGDMILASAQNNTGIKTFDSTTLAIFNPAKTFSYSIVSSAIAVNRNLILPLLTGNDTLVTEAFIQTLTNKTLTSPQINGAKLETSSTVGYVWTATDTAGAGSWQAGGGGSFWSLATGGTLTGANTITGTTTNTLKYVFDSLGVTQTNGAGHWLANTTAAAAGAQQISPSLVLEGQGWRTNATAESQSVKVLNYVLPVQGAANPSAAFLWQYSINGGANITFMRWDQIGDQLTVPNSLFYNGSLIIRSGGTSAVTIGNAVTTVAVGAVNITNQNNYANTSGTVNHLSLGNSFNPASGTAIFNSLFITQGINQTGGANGQITGINLVHVITAAVNVTGIDWNPTNPNNISGTHLAFRATSGQVVFGHTAAVANNRLGVRGIGTTTGLTLLLEDSSGTDTFGFDDSGKMYHYVTPANDNALTQILVRDSGTGEIKYRTAASLGGGSSTGAVNEVQTSDGVGGFLSGQVTMATNAMTLGLSGNTNTAYTIAMLSAAVTQMTLNINSGNAGTAGIAGGALTLRGGTGNTSGSGGRVTLLGGTAGSTTGQGGGITLTSANGGATSGAGGTVIITSGSGTAGNSAGGAMTLTSGSGFGSQGAGTFSLVGGSGGATGSGGSIQLTAGASGSTSGTGGVINLTSGSSPTSGAGGAINLTTGDGGSTSGAAGAIAISTGSGLGGNSAGGSIQIVTGNTVGTPAGAPITISAGQSGTTGSGGSVSINGGDGGTTSGTGGVINLTAGSAQGGNALGGSINLLAGDSSGSGASGAINITGGGQSAPGTGAGGAVIITGGVGAATSGVGGAISITGGAAQAGNTNGGSVTIAGGLPTGSGVAGTITHSHKTFLTGSATLAPLNLVALGSNPTLPADGDLVYVTGTGFRGRSAGAWITFGAGGGGSSVGANNELQTSDGAGGFVASKMFFDETTGHTTLGDAGLAGASRNFTVVGSAANIGVEYTLKGVSPFIVRSNGGFSIQDTGNTYSIILQQGSASTDPYIQASRGGSAKLFSILGSEGEASGSVNGGDILLKAGIAVGGNGNGASAYISYGTKNGSGTDGNIGLLTTNVANWQAMERGLFVANALTAPTGNPTGGAFFYADPITSLPMWRVPGGTTYDLTAGGGASNPSVTTVSSSTTTTISGIERTLLGDTTSASFTTTLPTAAGNSGYKYQLKKIIAANVWTIACNGAETIDGGTTAVINYQWECITIQSDGTNWLIL